MNAPHRPLVRFLCGLVLFAAICRPALVRAQNAGVVDNDEKKAILYKISRTDKISITVVG